MINTLRASINSVLFNASSNIFCEHDEVMRAEREGEKEGGGREGERGTMTAAKEDER